MWPWAHQLNGTQERVKKNHMVLWDQALLGLGIGLRGFSKTLKDPEVCAGRRV